MASISSELGLGRIGFQVGPWIVRLYADANRISGDLVRIFRVVHFQVGCKREDPALMTRQAKVRHQLIGATLDMKQTGTNQTPKNRQKLVLISRDARRLVP